MPATRSESLPIKDCDRITLIRFATCAWLGQNRSTARQEGGLRAYVPTIRVLSREAKRELREL